MNPEVCARSSGFILHPSSFILPQLGGHVMSGMHTATAEQDRITASPWGGGRSPFATDWAKLMMWLFIISDALTFAALIATYGFMRYISPRWPIHEYEIFDMRLIGFMTFALISSS